MVRGYGTQTEPNRIISIPSTRLNWSFLACWCLKLICTVVDFLHHAASAQLGDSVMWITPSRNGESLPWHDTLRRSSISRFPISLSGLSVPPCTVVRFTRSPLSRRRFRSLPTYACDGESCLVRHRQRCPQFSMNTDHWCNSVGLAKGWRGWLLNGPGPPLTLARRSRTAYDLPRAYSSRPMRGGSSDPPHPIFTHIYSRTNLKYNKI